MRDTKIYDDIASSDLMDGIKSGRIRVCDEFRNDPAKDADVLLGRILRLTYPAGLPDTFRIPAKPRAMPERGIKTLNLLGLWYTAPGSLPVLQVSINHMARDGAVQHWTNKVVACSFCQYADICDRQYVDRYRQSSEE